MTKELILNLCKHFVLSTGIPLRLYQNNIKIHTYSPFSFHPDPFSLYEEEMLCTPYSAIIFTTDLFQFYGVLQLNEEYLIAIGPSCILTDDEAGLQKLMFLLGVHEDAAIEYCRKLYCMPAVNMESLLSGLALLHSAVNQTPFSPENVHIITNRQLSANPIPQQSANRSILDANDMEIRQIVQKSYSLEQMILFYIQTGQPDSLREITENTPNMIKAGKMAGDTLRQLKNMGICAATICSRAAIEGGLDSQTAFRLSDLYIQQFELLKDAVSIHNLINEMMLDYALRVQQIHYPGSNYSKLFKDCVHYVSQNLSAPIRVEDIAKALGKSRPYLCSYFKEVTGVTLTHYIMTEKVNEAKRLLLFTDKSLSDISMYLSFSSQSHFQTTFKRITGKTPLEFRRSRQQP